MQPQETGFDWWHALSGMVGATVGAGSTLLTWIIRAARMEPTIRAEIVAAEQRVEKATEDKIEELVGHFQEAFAAIRQQINTQALELERDFMRKRDYEALREEDRKAFERFQDRYFKEFDDLKRNISEIVGARKH